MGNTVRKPKVLIIEDDRMHQTNYTDALGERVVLLSAFTVEEGERLFLQHPDIDLVVMDACVPGDDPTTFPLTCLIRKTFSGPMIAASSNPKLRQELMQHGCDYESEKRGVPRIVRTILGLA